MPSTFRFLRFLALAAVLVYAAMVALVWAVHPRQTEFSQPITVNVPPRPDTAVDTEPPTGTIAVDPVQ